MELLSKLTEGMKKKKVKGGSIFSATPKSKALSKKIETPNYDMFRKRIGMKK